MHARRRRGFTLSETLVASALALALGVVVLLIYLQVEDAVDHSTEQMELVQRARLLVGKVQPLVASAVSRNGFAALSVDDVDFGDLSDESRLQITTVEDFLDPEYDFQQNFRPLLTTGSLHYEIHFQPEQQRVVLRKLKTDLAGGLTPDETVPERVVGTNIQGFGLALVSQNSLQLKVLVEGPEDSKRPDGKASFALLSALPVPFFTGR